MKRYQAQLKETIQLYEDEARSRSQIMEQVGISERKRAKGAKGAKRAKRVKWQKGKLEGQTILKNRINTITEKKL